MMHDAHDEQQARSFRKIESACSLGHGKWRATLECGHSVVEDADVHRPSRTTQCFCPLCDSELEP